jgi:hypothetical protein
LPIARSIARRSVSSCGETKMNASPTASARAVRPDAVDVVVGRGRHVEVDDVRQRLHVDAARRDVGRDQHRELVVLEAGESRRALRLAAVAVDAPVLDAVLRQVLGQPVRAVLGAREHDHAADVAALQQLAQERRLQLLRRPGRPPG